MIELNRKVAERLRELGKLTQLNGELTFKSRAYEMAADKIITLQTPVNEVRTIDMPGIGPSISSKIAQIVETGTCSKLEELRAKYSDLLALLAIPGIGPATARNLKSVHQVTTVDGLRKLIARGIIKDKRIISGLDIPPDRIPLTSAKISADQIVARIHANFGGSGIFAEVAGSIRRKKSDIGDIDIVVSSENLTKCIIAARKSLDIVTDDGNTKVAGVVFDIRTDIRIAHPSAFGAMLLYATGSKETNVSMRQKAIAMGATLNEYGLWDGDRCMACATEYEIFEALKMEYLQPEKR